MSAYRSFNKVMKKIVVKSVVEIIEKGCDDIGDKGFDILTGYGRVNFLKTLQLAKDFGR